MKKTFYGWLTGIVFLLVHGQAGLVNSEEKIKIYQLTYQSQNVTGNITINGFVITVMKGKTGTGTDVLNPWLIGDNEVNAELKKADPASPADFTLGLSVLERGTIVSTTDKGSLFSIEVKDKDFAKDGKATVAKKFKSALNFKQHLSDGGEAKVSEVLAYAQKYHALFAKKDAEGILRESDVRINDYSKALAGEDMKAEMRKYLKDEIFKAKLTKLNPSKLRAITVGPTKKIWHVFNGNDELIKLKLPDGSILEMAVYIGLLDGKLKVIR